MLQLFDNQAVGSIGKPATLRSAVWSIVIHGSVFLFLFTLGLSPAFQALPGYVNLVPLVAPLPPPPPAPAPPTSAAVSRLVRRATRVFDAQLIAPVRIPAEVAVINLVEEAPPTFGVPGGIPGGIPGGMPGGVLTGIGTAIGLPPPPPPPPAATPEVNAPAPPPPPQRIQVNAEIQEAMLVNMVRPDYPPTAKASRIQGAVRLRAVVDRQGNITELEVIDGHPLLAAAARAAVEKWRYRPTILNGIAVEVATEILVTFRLQ